MESGQRVSRKGRKLGSSRRRQTREPADDQDALMVPESESWSSQAAAELQAFFQDCGAKERGVVTREDLAMAKFSFLGSEEEAEMIFDWVDVEQKGCLSLEEFSSGLKNIFGSSPSAHRLRRRRTPHSKRGSAAASFPGLEEADAGEKEAFFAFMEQLGSDHLLPEQVEIWQLWGKLRQEEPQLAGNLEGFLAKMSSRLQEAQADRKVLELTLRKRDSDHHNEVQKLYEEMEQQIRREKQQLQAESDSWDLAFSSQIQEVLEAKEHEVQQLTEGQRELEAQLHHLSSTHQETSLENQQLREAEHDLAGQLKEVRGQLQVTREHIHTARGRVSWQMEEEPSVSGAGEEKAPDLQAASSEEVTLPRLFGDNDDWDHLLSGFSSTPHRALQLSWSTPPTPRTPSGSQAPRVVRQISISEPHALLFGLEPASDSDPEGAPRSPPGVPSRAERKAVPPDWQDISPELTVEPHSPEPEEEPGPGALSHWSPPGVPAGEPGGLVAAELKELVPLEERSTPSVASPRPQASYPDDKGPGPAPAPTKSPRHGEALHLAPRPAGPGPGPGSLGAGALAAGLAEPPQGLEPEGQAPAEGLEQGKPGPHMQEGHPEGLREAYGQALGPDGLPALPSHRLEEEPRAEEGKEVDQGGQYLSSEQSAESAQFPQQDSLLAALPCDKPQAQAEEEAPAPGKPSPPRGSSPTGTQPGDGAGPREPTLTLPSLAELEAQSTAPPTTAHTEGEQGPPQSRQPGAANRPNGLGMDSGEAGLTPSPGSPMARDPDCIFHVIFLGDSNVGKTSFLHLLHQNSFATGLAATVGVDFRVKNLLVDNKWFALQLWDTAGQERYHSMTRQLLHKADGVVLMYDITSQESFAHVRYWLDCLQDAGSDEVAILLLGNKMDCEEERQVPTEAGQQLAQELGVSFGECSAALGHNILEPMVNLARSLKMQEDLLKGSLVEVAPERPQKKAGCCS
ncbi:Ras-Related Protein Rab-44 [Manis pentadactyla]|nr:Ras-Related Protein Rab-44 [Manis pentadactyla]